MRNSRLTGFQEFLPALCVAALLSFVTAAQANPQGGTMTNGAASITSSGNTETITQSTQNAVINWQSFNIGANQTTKFVQPNAAATTLNRVNSRNPSQILGTLGANGNVVLINPSGVFFGKGSQVDVNGLVATTANISTQNFMQSKLNFTQAGNPNAQVVNQGTITAGEAGLVGLVAPTVVNSGTINAKLGHVDLGSGDTFTLDTYGDGLITLGVSGAVKQQLIRNAGTINAAGGTIALTAGAGRQVVNSLIAMPGKLNAPTATMQNGEIDIVNAAPNGQVQVTGTLNAAGPARGQAGGLINITGSQTGINSGAAIDASGVAGGGAINIGGNLHGQGPLSNAETTLVDTGATVKANAINRGNGGQVVVWSNQQTTIKGQIQARGGPNGGNGGFVETSSHGLLDVETPVDASASKGRAGAWLLDPASLTISNGSDTDVIGCPSCTPDGLVATSNLTPATIEAALNAGTNVTIATGGDAAANTGDITLINAIITTTGTASLTVSSYRSMIVNAGITLTGGALVLQADNQGNGSGYIDIEAPISTAGGNITIVTDTDNFGPASNLTTGSGRCLVYSTNPAYNTLDGITPNFVRYGCVYQGVCPAIPAAGDGLLYSITPTLTATPAQIAVTYGSAKPSLSGYAYTLSGYLGSDAGLDTVTGSLNGVTPYTSASTVADGPYAIYRRRGLLSSAEGYSITYANNPAGIVVNPKALTITANNLNKTYGSTYTFTGTEFTASGLINGDTATTVTLASPGASAAAALGPYAITPSNAVGTGLLNYVITYDDGTLSVIPTLPPVSSLPGSVTAAVTGTGSTPDNSIDQGTGEADASAGSGMTLRNARNTSSIPPPLDPCSALAAQDTLANQMGDMMDIISISAELAESLPFYKIQTRAFDAAHISCGNSRSLQQN